MAIPLHFSALIGGVLVLASVRGALVYHLNVPAGPIYVASAAALLSFGLLSSVIFFGHRRLPKELREFKLACQANMVLLGLYWVAYAAIDLPTSISILYCFLMFPTVFVLIRIERAILEVTMLVILFFTAFGIVLAANAGSNELGGYNLVQDMLRPGEAGISHINGTLQSGGYQANHHDAANILVMANLYCIGQAFERTGAFRLFMWLAFSTGSLALALTGSASNIFVFLAMSLFMLLTRLRRNPVVSLLVVVLVTSLVLAVNNYFPIPNAALKFINYDEVQENSILTGLSVESLIESWPALFFGFGYHFDVPAKNAEIAFVKLLVSYGIIPSLVLLLVLFFPIFVIRRSRQELPSLLHVAPVLGGTLTLLHYGSLFRVTSIGLFCLIMALFIQNNFFRGRCQEELKYN
jgi:hypothetical protein